MRYQKSNQAFTLIEIAVVLIILGLIAVLAFPGLFAQIERHRGQEALSTMNLIKSSIESCGIQNAYSFASCGNTWDEIGMGNPNSATFTYAIPVHTAPANVNVQGIYQIVATRVGSPGDTITIDRNDAGVATCTGTNAFLGFC